MWTFLQIRRCIDERCRRIYDLGTGILSMVARPDKPPVPLGFGARNWDFHKLLEPGSQIWVVTRIANEFSLVGRVAVQDILDRNGISQENWPKETAGLFAKWRFVAIADPTNSEFFETNNAEPVMVKHEIRFAQNRTIIYRDASLKDSFKACIDQARETVFLSYRWHEGRRFAIALAREFRRKGLSPGLTRFPYRRTRLSVNRESMRQG